MRDHRRLRAFELTDGLVLAVYAATRQFPREEQFGPKSQLRRSAVSIPSNIVEGCVRESHAEYLRLLDIAFASTREIEYQLTLVELLGYITAETASQLARQASETARILSGLIGALRTKSG